MILAPTNRRIIRPYDKPSFEHTQRYGLIRGHPLGPAGGLVGLWLFNEGTGGKIYDLSGNDNNCIKGALDVFPTWVAGHFGSALSFNGSNTSLEAPDNLSLRLDDEVSVSVWFKISAEVVSTIISKDYREWELLIDTRDGNDRIVFYYGDGATYQDLLWNQVADDGLWHHIAVSMSKSLGTGECWFDCVSLGITSDSSQAGSSTNDLWIGARTGGSNVANVEIDHVAVWNHRLSASEIALLYREPFCMVQKKAAPIYFFVPVALPEEVDVDIVGGYNLTSYNTPSVAVHPSVIYPTGPQVIVAGEVHLIAGTADGQATAEAAVKVTREVVCTADGQATASAATKVARKVSGSTDGQATAGATAKVIRRISGGADAQAGASATLGILVFIVGTADAQSTAQATVTVRVFIIGTSDAQAGAAATVKILKKIVCTAAAQSTASMTIVGYVSIVCTAAGQSTAVCALIVTYAEIPPFMHEDLIAPYGDMGAWIWLVEIVVPTQATQRIARNTEVVVYGVTSFTAGNFDPPGRIPLAGDGSVPRIQLRMAQDTAKTLENIVNATKGGENGTVKLIRTCEKYFDSPVKAFERTYDILTAGSDPQWVTFTLGIPNPLLQRIPLWSYSSKVCPLATPSLFKGPRCQYAGEDATCTGLFEDCYAKGNAEHWGAEIGLDPSAVRI